MFIKADFNFLTPAIIKPYIPLDGVFSFSYADLTGFKYEGKRGYMYDNLLISRYGYVDELPIKKTFYGDGKWFYNISGMLFIEESETKIESDVVRQNTVIIRKYIEDTELWKRRFPNIENLKWIYSRKSGMGKERAYKFAVETIWYPKFSVILEIEEQKEDEVVKILENIKAVGKKVNQGYGFVEFTGYSGVEVNGFKFADTLIRPIPVDLVEERDDYYEIEMKLFTPYYIKNLKHTDFCFVDEKLMKGKIIKYESEFNPEF